jgi:hypothetical protein
VGPTMGTITTKTYLKDTIGRRMAIEMSDGKSIFGRDADGIYTLQEGAPLDPRDAKDTIKVVITETWEHQICSDGYYEDYAGATAVTDSVLSKDNVRLYRLIVSAPKRKDAMSLFNDIRSGVAQPAMPYIVHVTEATAPALEA